MNGFTLPPDALRLIAALAIGMLIGLERGWSNRDSPEGGRVAGLRTFSLTGLLGGVLGHLQPTLGAWPLIAALIGLSMLLTAAYYRSAKLSGNLSATTAVAMLLTLVLGTFAALDNVALALATAVIAAVLLNLKPTLHGWIRLIEHQELTAALQLLVLSLVILPYLPNTGLGPYAALNPYILWWAVILVAGLSLAGHFAMRLSGSERGILWTGLLGGLASSTAATLTLARYARRQPLMANAVASATLAACSVMFLRMAVLVGIIAPALLFSVGATAIMCWLVMLGLALWIWRRSPHDAEEDSRIESMKPFELGTALGFATFLALIAVLFPAAQQWLGTGGIYVLSALSGLGGVDAILISLARLHDTGSLPTTTVAWASSLAAIANMVIKAAIAWTTGGTQVGKPVVTGYLITLSFGGVALWLALQLSGALE